MNSRAMVLTAWIGALTACHSMPAVEQPASVRAEQQEPAATESSSPIAQDQGAETGQVSNSDAASSIPPCLPEAAKQKVIAKRRPRPTQAAEKPVPVETQPPRLGASTPEVKPIDSSLASILGRKVQSSDGEDLGRVVDIQADGGGRVRLVIIEFGGFLGVGNRRAAVDWGLLRFHPDDPDQPLSLGVSSRQVQDTPEYRQASRPRALMAPSPVLPASTPPQNQ